MDANLFDSHHQESCTLLMVELLFTPNNPSN